MLSLAVATRCLQLPLTEALRATARAGIPAVQLDIREELAPGELTETGIRQFRHQLEELNLTLGTVTFPLRRPLADAERLEERVAALRQALAFGWKLGVNVLTVRLGRIPDAETRGHDLLREVLTDLAREGNHVGVTLTVTPLHDAPLSVKKLLNQITSGPVGVDLDPAGLVMGGHDPAEAIRLLHDRILHVQARDGLRDVDGSGVESEFGRGQVDWPETLALLHEAAYTGWITAVRNQGQETARDVLRTVAQLKQMAYG